MIGARCFTPAAAGASTTAAKAAARTITGPLVVAPRRCTAAHARRASVVASAASSSSNNPHALITGANTGIGFETAKDLARKGYDVTLACRDDAKASAAAAAVRAVAAPGVDVRTLRLDLANFASCRDAANAFLDTGARLDVLINNAGIMAPPTRMESVDGFELQLQSNHLGHFAFTSRVFPVLRRAETPAAPSAAGFPAAVAKRLVVVSSSAHLIPGMDLDDLNWTRRDYKAWPAYGSSKLANLLFSYELARRLPSPAATSSDGKAALSVNALMPGVVRTELSRFIMPNKESIGARLLGLLTLPITLDPVAGAATTIRLATDPDLEGVTGKYYDVYKSGGKPGGKPVQSAGTPSSYDEAAARKLWTWSEEATGVAFEV